jgi:hypothetical protein
MLVAAAGLELVRLHALSTGLSPVRDAVSDYGTTRFHAHYRLMVVLFGLARRCSPSGLPATPILEASSGCGCTRRVGPPSRAS